MRDQSFKENAVGICLCFPDLYETAFANMGLSILYHIINNSSYAYAERAYVILEDVSVILREKEMSLFFIESQTPLCQFEIVGFGLPYELCYTNILEVLDLAKIPIYSRNRRESDPLIIGGVPCSVNPEPIADFFDLIVIGDGEDVILEIAQCVSEGRKNKIKNLFCLMENIENEKQEN